MKLANGLYLDSQPINQPQGTYRNAENALINKKMGAICSEEGNIERIDLSAHGLSSHNIIGDTLVHDGRHILFLTDGSNHEIGILDENNYTRLINDTNLNFSIDSMVESTSNINNNGEVIVYWTDDINPIRLLNVDKILSSGVYYSDTNELNLFPYINESAEVSLNSVEDSGGSLTTGAYYFALAYIDEDSTVTNYFTVTSPVYIRSGAGTGGFGDPAGTSTGKVINLQLNNIDQSYDKIRVVAIKREGGVLTSPKILPDVTITSSSQTIIYSGNETTIDGSLDEIVIDNANYAKAKTLAQINNILYIGNLERKEDVGYQKFANNIKVEVVSKETNSIDYTKDEDYIFLNKSFKRDEVYAFYISFVLKDGSESYAYHIPGREMKDGEDDTITSSTSGYGQDVEDVDANNKSFQFEENPDTTISNMNYWENENETYPDTEDFDVYTVDDNGDPVDINRSIRNAPVRHHHFPSNTIEPCVNNNETFNLLGIKFKDIKIPGNMLDDISAVKIYYAKRTSANKRILDQSLLTGRVAKDILDPDLAAYYNYLPNPGATSNQYHSTSGENAVASIPFNLMRTKDSIGALTHVKQIATPKVDGNGDIDVDPDDGAAFLSYDLSDNLLTDESDYQAVVADDFIRKINHKSYVPSHIQDVNLTQLGFAYDANTFKEESKIWLEIDRFLEVGAEYLGTNQDFRMRFISDLFAHKTDVYNSFDQQELVWTGYLETDLDKFDPTVDGNSDGSPTSGEIEVTGANVSPGGFFEIDISTTEYSDTFTVTLSGNETTSQIASLIFDELSTDYEFNYYFDITDSNPLIITARRNNPDLNGTITIDDSSTGATFTDTDLTGGSANTNTNTFETSVVYNGDTFVNLYGVRVTRQDGEDKVVYYYPCESSDNIALRHSGENFGDTFYPLTDLIPITTLEDDDNSSNDDVWYDNFIGYNSDYSTHGDIKTAVPRPKELEERLKHPTRVARSQENIPGNEENGFRIFLENDYLDLQRDRGELVKLSVLNNVLLPHMRRSLIRTKGREEITTGDIRAFIGSGDIFSVKPDEIKSTEAGFAGLQDPQSALTTPYGYFFVDRDARKVFLIGQSPQEISSSGLRNFFEDKLSNYDSSNDKLISTWDDKWDRILLTYIDDDDSDKSFTLSYYPQLEVWGSFHSYKPKYYLQQLDTFFSVTGDSIYEHNDNDNSCFFNGSTEDFVIEFVDNRSPVESKYFANIEFITEVVDESTNPSENFFKETFDQFRIKNAYQDSGDQSIIYFDQAGGNARNVEGTWKINKFRDMLVNGSVDVNKPWQDRSRLIGKYAQVELIYNNSDNKFLYLHDVKVGMRVSRR